ncbi:chemotaxis protein CheD [Legionella impletisoli]|uniref:Probable chemoreceptor glutamine deamidase CheD n=1 Tax=Legionella impletisoli TaxID=343510 RepID=A0A917JND9_9GAMM|nr:chemotaxis protein CheD [Legionella impletisoli]GGI78169.1 putative chemoreceptor glutamine deamidase CheD [Legionella impletisoli]
MSIKQVHINMADLQVARCPDELICIGLGSCIGLVLYDPRQKIGGIAHVMLPNSRNVDTITHPGKFANTALPELLKKMRAKGAKLEEIQALVFGGANMFPQRGNPERSIGKSNAEAVLYELKLANIPVLGCDIGGHSGRSIYFDTCRGQVKLKKSKESIEKRYVFKGKVR